MKLQAIAVALWFGLVSTTASALAFDVTYDASVASAPSSFKTAFQDAINFYQNTFSNPITINIIVGWGKINGHALKANALGASSHSNVLENYSTVSALLNKINPTYVLPATSQIKGNIGVSFAEAGALGINVGNGLDGSVGFGSSASWNYTPNTAAPGEYNLFSVAEHEISEVMGRTSLLNTTCTGNYCAQQSVLDLYRYTAPGVLATTGGKAYFSTNGGVTNINTFNGNAGKGDLGDWARLTSDAFNYASSPGYNPPFSAGDITLMKALGYTLTSPVPEPETYRLLLCGLGMMGFMARRRKNI